VLLAIAIRSVVLVGVSAGVAALYSRAHPDDDGLGTGLTVMMLLLVLSAIWGLVDGFRRGPVDLCVVWVVVGVVWRTATTITADLGHGSVDWSVVAQDLRSGLLFWAALVFVPAIGCGILSASIRRAQTGSTRAPGPPAETRSPRSR
jgi:hypothetical protein